MYKFQDEINTPNKANVSLVVKKTTSLTQKKDSIIFWSFIGVSFFSISVCVGYVGTFLLFK